MAGENQNPGKERDPESGVDCALSDAEAEVGQVFKAKGLTQYSLGQRPGQARATPQVNVPSAPQH